jgi:putative intracellular protease/amidase
MYVMDTLADWEIGYLTAEVHSKRFFSNKSIECNIVKVGKDTSPVTTMGGMIITPDISINELELKDEDILVLPGGDTWMNPENDGILGIAKGRIGKNLLVAAICGATCGLARVDALNSKKHTSNDLEFLKYMVKGYAGSDKYLNLPAVNDNNLITASGQSALEFTYEIIKALNLFNSSTLEAWKNLNQTNEARYFFEMMRSLEYRNGEQ